MWWQQTDIDSQIFIADDHIFYPTQASYHCTSAFSPLCSPWGGDRPRAPTYPGGESWGPRSARRPQRQYTRPCRVQQHHLAPNPNRACWRYASLTFYYENDTGLVIPISTNRPTQQPFCPSPPGKTPPTGRRLTSQTPSRSKGRGSVSPAASLPSYTSTAFSVRVSTFHGPWYPSFIDCLLAGGDRWVYRRTIGISAVPGALQLHNLARVGGTLSTPAGPSTAIPPC